MSETDRTSTGPSPRDGADAESEEVPLPLAEPRPGSDRDPPAPGAAIVIRVPAADGAPAAIRAAPDASDSDDDAAPAPTHARLPRRLAGVCDEATWRLFVPAVFANAAAVARRVVGDDETDVVSFVRAAIEGMSFSSESARFSTLGIDVGVPGATPQCIDLLAGLLRVTAARAAQSGELARPFAGAAALEAHLTETGARVCALPFAQSWMVIAAASARAAAWAPVERKRKRDEPDAAAVASLAAAMGVAPAAAEAPAVRAGRAKRKREE